MDGQKVECEESVHGAASSTIPRDSSKESTKPVVPIITEQVLPEVRVETFAEGQFCTTFSAVTPHLCVIMMMMCSASARITLPEEYCLAV